MTMRTLFLTNGDVEIEVTARQSVRAKRVAIRVKGGGKVELIIPQRASFKSAHKFLLEKESWIRSRAVVATPEKQASISVGEYITILGKPRLIMLAAVKTINLENEQISFPEHVNDNLKFELRIFLLSLLKNILENDVKEFANVLGVEYKKISLSNALTRWGSCTADGNLKFSWRLVFAPISVIQYVVAHEVAHLVHMDHSKKFWNTVAKIYPDYKAQRAWLKKHGATLHYCFT